MANLVYLTLKGEIQGLISEKCCTLNSVGNKAQIAHRDQIMVYAANHTISRVQNVNHHDMVVIKPIDKSSPLLAKAINDNETLHCEFDFYRTNRAGMAEIFYRVKLIKAKISNISLIVPHITTSPADEIQEKISFSYESINWEHFSAGTSAFSLWDERIY